MNDPLQRIADNIAALTRAHTTTVEYVRAPGTGADGVHRRTPEHGTHRARQDSLLIQLIRALPPGAAPAGDGSARGKPGSRPPANPAASAAFDAILNGARTRHDYTPGVWELRRYLRRATGRPTPNTPRTRIGLETALHDIRGLAHQLPEEYQHEAARVTGAYVTHARAALAYEAPQATLRDVVCRYCSGPLRVPADASGPVRCATAGCRDEGGRRPEWPRETWHLLLIDEGVEGAA